jgi:hypothetical protein
LWNDTRRSSIVGFVTRRRKRKARTAVDMPQTHLISEPDLLPRCSPVSMPSAPAPCPKPTPLGLPRGKRDRVVADDSSSNLPEFTAVALLAEDAAFMFGHGHCF